MVRWKHIEKSVKRSKIGFPWLFRNFALIKPQLLLTKCKNEEIQPIALRTALQSVCFGTEASTS